MRQVSNFILMRCVGVTLLFLIGAGAALAAEPQKPATDAARAADPGKILVLPFAPVNSADANKWLGRSVQQSLLADLMVVLPSHVLSGDSPVEDMAAAVAAAKKADAHFVVYGTFVSVDPDVRITGQIVDAAAGVSIGGLKATGTTHDLFRMEDTLAMQLKDRLGVRPPADLQDDRDG